MKSTYTKYISYLSFIFFFVFLNANNENYIVETTSGVTKAIVKNKILNWNDIPYAAPPIKDLRWRAPKPIITPKNIILDKENNFCLQEPSNLGGVDGNHYVVGSEDCLYLDIKAPKKNFKDRHLPVMFWIHGGGNVSGLKDL